MGNLSYNRGTIVTSVLLVQSILQRRDLPRCPSPITKVEGLAGRCGAITDSMATIVVV